MANILTRMAAGVASSLGLEEHPAPITPLPTTKAAEAVTPKEVPAMATTSNPFQHIAGSGKENKAAYKLGKTLVPVAVITRIQKDVEGKPAHRASFIFQSKLMKNYTPFIDALDAQGIEYLEALKLMNEVKPKKAAGTGTGKTPTAKKTAEALSKAVCKRYKGAPDQIVSEFIKTVNSAEFQADLIGIIQSYQKTFKLNPQGFTKTSNRQANPKALKALAEDRKKKAAEKAKKK